MKQSISIFENQSTAISKSAINGYGCESMTIQTECSGNFQLKILSRVNSEFQYQPMDIITDDFDIISTIVKSGIYTVNLSGRRSVEFQLISIDDGAALNCFAILY